MGQPIDDLYHTSMDEYNEAVSGFVAREDRTTKYYSELHRELTVIGLSPYIEKGAQIDSRQILLLPWEEKNQNQVVKGTHTREEFEAMKKQYGF